VAKTESDFDPKAVSPKAPSAWCNWCRKPQRPSAQIRAVAPLCGCYTQAVATSPRIVACRFVLRCRRRLRWEPGVRRLPPRYLSQGRPV